MATVKKTKKVETPIDQRETFVSLQKNFADSDLSVEEKLKTLYDLQKADSELDKIFQLRGELPEEVAALEEEIASLKADQASLTAQIDEFTRNIGERKQDIVQIAEKNINEIKYEIAARKADIEDIKDHISIRTEDLKAKKDELAVIVESTSKEEAELQAKRDECAAKIDERTMSAYNRIRASVHNHLAVVGVYNNNACGGCFNTITPQRLIEIASNKKLIICEHCGRIIINPDFD